MAQEPQVTGTNVGVGYHPTEKREPYALEAVVNFATNKDERHILRSVVEAFKPSRKKASELKKQLEKDIEQLRTLQMECRTAYQKMNDVFESGTGARELNNLRETVLNKARESLTLEFDIRSNQVPEFLSAVQHELSPQEEKLKENKKNVQQRIHDKLKEAGFTEECGIPPPEGRINQSHTYYSHAWEHPELRRVRVQQNQHKEKNRKIREHDDSNLQALNKVRDYLQDALNQV